MTPMSLSLGVATFSYGGNGSVSSTHPDVMYWLIKNVPLMKADPRISEVWLSDFADTPITMNRNRAVSAAMQRNTDLLLMIDSDMAPDLYLGLEPDAQPFFSSSLDFIYKHWSEGPSLVAAPYCGPPPHENIYIFRWQDFETGTLIDNWSLSQYTRHEAAQMMGIQEVAALPTGLILCDMRAFEMTRPKKKGTKAIKGDNPWFYYEYSDIEQGYKCSTEDVTATRDISFAGIGKYGRNPLYCHWSSWAGHWKPKCVGKPVTIGSDFVVGRIREAMEKSLPANTKLANVDYSAGLNIDWGKAPTGPTVLESVRPHRNGKKPGRKVVKK